MECSSPTLTQSQLQNCVHDMYTTLRKYRHAYMHACMDTHTNTHTCTLATLVLDYACACTTKVAIYLARSEQISLLFLLTHVTYYKESKCRKYARCVASTIIKIYPWQM